MRVLLVALVILAACKRDPPPAPPAPPAEASDKLDENDDDMKAARKAAAEPEEPVAPVYPVDPNVHPLAERFCQAVQGLPLRRAAACCKSPARNDLGLSSCRTGLSAALKSGAVMLAESDVNACQAAMEKALEGCDWVGSEGGLSPPACDGAIKGTLKEGVVCRSSVECAAGLFCKGAGPTESGVCSAPQKPGAMCNASVDPLAFAAHQFNILVERPECDGSCDRHLCIPVPEKCELVNPWHCGTKARCVDGKCVPGRFVGKGQVCRGASCESGLACIDGVCTEPRPTGAACLVHEECKGGCLRKRGAEKGVCGMFCGVTGADL